MENEPSQLPTPDETQRRQFTRVNTYIPDDLSDKLRNVGARIRKSVTEGYATNKWDGEPLAPNVPHTRTQLGLGRPSIFQSSSGEGMRRVYTTPHPFTQPTRGLQPFAESGEPPARPAPGATMRARATSLGVQRATPAAAPSQRRSSGKQVPDGFDSPSDSESDNGKSPGDADTLGELFEFGEEEKSSSVGSSMFASASRPPAVPITSGGNTRTFQQTQSLPAGSLAFAVQPVHSTPLESLGEDEPWRKQDFGKNAAPE